MRLALALMLAAAMPALGNHGIKVRRVGPMIDAQANPARIIGQDIASSISLGKSALWLYGDTFYSRRKPDGSPDLQGAITNSAALSADLDASDGITGLIPLMDSNENPRAVLGYDPDENPERLRLWPGHGLKLGDKIYLYYSMVDITGEGSWNFKHAGQGLAVGQDPRQAFTRLKWRELFEFWSSSEPRFGIAGIEGKDGWLYLYGRDEAKPNAMRLARVKPKNIENRADYEYWKDSAWTTEVSSAAALFADAPPEASVSFNHYLGHYVMLYSRFLQKDVVIRTAAHPWGPWTRERPIYHCKPSRPDAFCYAAKEHPEYATEGGRRIYFTIVDSAEAQGGMPELFEATFRPTGAEPERKKDYHGH